MAEVNFSPKLAGSLISILPRAAAKTFENRSNPAICDLDSQSASACDIKQIGSAYSISATVPSPQIKCHAALLQPDQEYQEGTRDMVKIAQLDSCSSKFVDFELRRSHRLSWLQLRHCEDNQERSC
jgi:hypothetical protein